MKADVEWVVGVIRAGPDFKEHGDPYEFVCSIMKQDRKAFLMAASGTFNKETYKAVEQLVRTLDVDHVSWDRKNIKQRKIRKDVL